LKALIPAAGLGTRWFPWSRIIPKELLPLGNYPVIHHVLDEVVAAGIFEIGIIINNVKQLLRSYVEEIWVVNHPGIMLKWFYQPLPRGVGDALLCAKEWVNNEAAAIIYPDEIHPKEGGISQIRTAYQSFHASWIGLISRKQKRRQMSFAIEKIGEKVFYVSGPSNQTSANKIGYGTGRYILANGFRHLKGTLLQTENQNIDEIDDSHIFAPLWIHDIRGVFLREPIYDVGIPENWHFAIQAQLHQQRSDSKSLR
jgi:UTP-glucose-1-phosphate uridylyltransferase